MEATNNMQVREALEMARDALKSAEKYVYGDPPDGGAIGWDDVWPSEWHHALEAVELALSAPPRRCDVYDPDKAAHMMEVEYCGSMPPGHCDGTNCTRCSFKWFTSPAEKGGAK